VVYPSWGWYPLNMRPVDWVDPFLAVIASAEQLISTEDTVRAGESSDGVLRAMRPGLEALGYVVETGKAARDKIERPVLFGENGRPAVKYEVDAVHHSEGIVVEVEAGRGARNNASYRDLVRTSLIVDARFLALVLPLHYRYGQKQTDVQAYRECRDLLAAMYASRRLTLPFEGVLLVGY
jgi:hypothetical protein